MSEDEIVSTVQNEDSDSDSNSSDELSLQCPVSHAQEYGVRHMGHLKLHLSGSNHSKQTQLI